MAEVSVITEELRGLLGVEWGPQVYEIEKGMIRKLAEAIDDPNPLWQDEAHAKKTRYGSIIAPPTFVTSLRLDELYGQVKMAKCPLTRLLNGGNEIEYYQPIKVGDTISVTGKLVDLRERTGKREKMLFMVLELTYKNQRDEVAAIGRNTLIKH